MSTYAGTFLIAFSTLALQICLSRLLSVAAWYHLAFFAISTAMLGMTAGATTVYLRPKLYGSERLQESMAKACFGYALSVPAALILLCLLPLELPLDARRMTMGFASLLFATLACSLPFYFSGIALSAVLTRSKLPIGRLYAVDLAGAAAGCLFVLGALSVFSAPSCILLCGVLGAVSGWLYGQGPQQAPGFLRRSLVVFAGVLLVFIANSVSPFGIRPVFVKGRLEDPRATLLERWNSFSRVAVYHRFQGVPQLWAGSVVAPRAAVAQHYINIDGEAGTTMRQFRTKADIEHLRYDVTNVAYHIRGGGNAAVIGVGGGRDVQAALLFGHERVVGIDVNPIFIDLAQGKFRDFSGIGDNERVELVVDEARSYLSRSEERFSVVQMSLIDTWAATGAGAFSLSENALYTVEGWKVFIDRLKDDGVFTVSRWYTPQNLAETGRILSLAVSTLWELGVEKPRDHIVLVTNRNVSTLLLKRTPFSKDEIAQLEQVASEMRFVLAIAPQKAPPPGALSDLLEATSPSDLRSRVEKYPLNYAPPTDQTPYFFNMLKLGSLSEVVKNKMFMVQGNLAATVMLVGLILVLLLIAAATVIVPLRMGKRKFPDTPSVRLDSALYFCLIGAGFMCVEIALIQRLSLFLGHPVYGLGVLLFTIILSTGLGSALSERLTLRDKRHALALPIIAAVLILVIDQMVSWLLAGWITESTLQKSVMSVATVLPLGLVLGFFFPVGMRLSERLSNAQSPWYWALNGIFGVLFSAVAVLISIYGSVSTNFYISALCYLGLFLCIRSMWRKRGSGLRDSMAKQ